MDSIFEMEDYPKVLNRLQNQCAKREYTERMQYVVANQPNLSVVEDAVVDLIVDDHSVVNSTTHDDGKNNDKVISSDSATSSDSITSDAVKIPFIGINKTVSLNIWGSLTIFREILLRYICSKRRIETKYRFC